MAERKYRFRKLRKSPLLIGPYKLFKKPEMFHVHCLKKSCVHHTHVNCYIIQF